MAPQPQPPARQNGPAAACPPRNKAASVQKKGSCCGCRKKREIEKKKPAAPPVNTKKPPGVPCRPPTQKPPPRAPTTKKSQSKPIFTPRNSTSRASRRLRPKPPLKAVNPLPQTKPSVHAPALKQPDTAQTPAPVPSDPKPEVDPLPDISRRSGRLLALEGRRTFQEVTVCVANLDNGMTEHKMVLSSFYPTDRPPLPPVRRSGARTVHSSVTPVPCRVQASPRPVMRDHYQLTREEVRLLAHHPDLKSIVMRAGLALQDAQRNLRNLRILAGRHLLPDLGLFNDELSAVIVEMERFIDAIHAVSEHVERSPAKIWHAVD